MTERYLPFYGGTIGGANQPALYAYLNSFGGYGYPFGWYGGCTGCGGFRGCGCATHGGGYGYPVGTFGSNGGYGYPFGTTSGYGGYGYPVGTFGGNGGYGYPFGAFGGYDGYGMY